jgi:hypothetical protein
MRVTINDREYLIFDQFCLLPGCSCTHTVMDILPETEAETATEASFALKLIYTKKRWETDEDLPGSITLAAVRSAIEEFLPAQPAQSSKVGRNDPCPCGSGKKYKKCCFGKASAGKTSGVLSREKIDSVLWQKEIRNEWDHR